MRIGVLTGGGDAPGLNAAIRAVVLRADALGHSVLGIHDGWAGLLGDGKVRPLGVDDVRDILGLGGTILATSRTDPRKNPAHKAEVLANFTRHRLDALVAIGGNDTLGVGAWLHEQGVKVVGIPKTVDNDLAETEHCIGFDTAASVVADAIDRLRSSASAHHRVMVVEAMGRDTGWVAAVGGLAGGADLILVPERPVSLDKVIAAVHDLRATGDDDIIVVVAEAVEIDGLEAAVPAERDAFGHPRLDQRNMGQRLARAIEDRTKIEARYVVLGHLQRGGSPTVVDRNWATRFGDAAVDLLVEGRFGQVAIARGARVEHATLAACALTTRRVPDDLLRLIDRFAGTRP